MAKSNEEAQTKVEEQSDGDSMEAVLQPETSVNMSDPEVDLKSSPRPSERGEDVDFDSVAGVQETERRETAVKVDPDTLVDMCNPELIKSSTRLSEHGEDADFVFAAAEKEPERKETGVKTEPETLADICNPDMIDSSTRSSQHGEDSNFDSVCVGKETGARVEPESSVHLCNSEMIKSPTRLSQHGEDIVFGSVAVEKDIGAKPEALVHLGYPEVDPECSSGFSGQGDGDDFGFVEKEMERKTETREEPEELVDTDDPEIHPKPSPRLPEHLEGVDFGSVEEETEKKTEAREEPEEVVHRDDPEIHPKPSPRLPEHVEGVDFGSVEQETEKKTEDKVKPEELMETGEPEIDPKPSLRLSEHGEDVDFGSDEEEMERKTQDKMKPEDSADMGDPEIEPKPSEHGEDVDFGSVAVEKETERKEPGTEVEREPSVDLGDPEVKISSSPRVERGEDVDSTSVTAGKETEGLEPAAKVEREPSVDLGDPEVKLSSSPRVERGGDVDFTSVTVEEDSVSKAVHADGSESAKTPSSSQECLPSTDTTNSVMFLGSDRPGSASGSDRDCIEVKLEEGSSLREGNVDNKDTSLEEKPLRPAASEDTNMDTSDCNQDRTNPDEKMDLDTDGNRDISPEKAKESSGSKLIDSAANDLDELMDIGTVDQMEQEAQMKEEEKNILMDVDSSSSSAVSNTVPEDSNSAAEDADMKPSVVPQLPEEDQSEDVKMSAETQSTSSSSSETAADTGKEATAAASVVKGMKIVKLPATTLDTDTAEPVKACVTPPLVKVKDEPMDDDEYEQPLMSSIPTASVKDEPNSAKEDLKIGSVYSVTSTETPSVPQHLSSPPSHMTCSHCGRSLTKGQTAFQRKGSPGLFCSATCLSMSLPAVKTATKICHYCQKMILRPQDVINSPDAKGVMKEFCSQNCLSTFNYKRNASAKLTIPPLAPKSVCSMCTRYCISKHEVILNSTVHKICSDACFTRFRAVNRLSMASCANCSSYCHKNPLMLKLEDCNKTLCNAECVVKFKEKTKTPQPCTMCRTTRNISDMVDNKNSDDSVNLFCSSSCVMAFKVQTVSASGVRLNCDNCGKNTVPSYHLAMSDTSIRNFCTLPCVMAFQEKFKKNPNQVNVFTKLPVESTPIQTATPIKSQADVSKGQAKLNCSQCSCSITFKPELIQITDKMVFLCSVACSQEYKKANNVVSLCEYCKIEKITKETKRINKKNCSFCSDGCKLLFRHDLTKNWGKHCHSCAYCLCVSQKLVTAHYGGTTEEFCSDECRSKYTMLFCHVAKCDTCGQKGKLKQSLPLLGEVKHFCDLNCLLQFCSNTVLTQGDVIGKGGVEDTPVIANVVSLASPTAENPNTSDNTIQQNTVPNLQKKTSEHANMQREAPPKILKNKALMCRPLVQNKGISCRTQTVDIESQTDEFLPKLLVMPVPVPVYVPVPMSMYSQCTPKTVGLPLPLPVPMFLPVTLNSAERIVETIQQIKEKIPSDPFEAELILMAEMVAEDDETKKEAEKKPKDRAAEKERDREEAAAPDEHASTYSDDLDTEADLASFLNTWEDPSSETSLRSPNPPFAQEKVPPGFEAPAGMPGQPYPEPAPPAPPPMDIEAEFTVEALEKMARIKEQLRHPPSPPPAPARRPRQAQRKAREKRGRKPRLTKAADAPSQRAASKKAACADILKLKSLYGIDAWKRWIQWRDAQPNQEKPRIGSRLIELKEDLLRCTTAELSYGLCCFINEVKRPNGEAYSPDSLFYLCLGIQKFLFENGRVENIFMDRFYNKFSTEFTVMLKNFQPSVSASGYIHSRVEEEFLWDCKQLGAYSPIVLLNTLLFFCCKYFGFTTVEQHRQLSFAHVMRCTKTNPDNSKTTFLRFYPPIAINEDFHQDPNCVPAKKRREEDGSDDILEMMENTENPLRCPVRLYEFYLSKCSESVKQRTNLFYLHPERSCVPNSPLWFSSSALDDATMEAMLIRILTVREVRVTMQKAGKGAKTQQAADDPPFTPDREEEEEESE